MEFVSAAVSYEMPDDGVPNQRKISDRIKNLVPDELILSKSSLPGYFESIADENFPSLEYAGTLLLRDFSNELVPRWLLINLSQPFNVDGFSQLHEVLLQDHQPNWSNSQLLSSYGL